jgi:uncharacterized membrane protein YdjX (TVP38/TMEM64 family)
VTNSAGDPSPSERAAPPRNWARLLLLPAVIGIALAVFYGFHLNQYLTFTALATHRAWLLQWISHNIVLGGLTFAAVYVVATAISVPGDSLLTILAGFLFGTVLGTAIAVVAATLGSVALFVLAQTSLGEIFRSRSEGTLATVRAGFQRDALSYLLFLRLVPIFPFWVVNLVSAFLAIPLRIFFIGTLVGIIPGTAVFASIGSGLGAILDRGQEPDLNVIFSFRLLIPILALAVLSLAPAAYRRLRRS